MKYLSILTLASLLSASAYGSSMKICFGSTKSDDTKGVVITAEINYHEIKIQTIKGELGYNGAYNALNGAVRGRDGQTYLTYNGERTDYQDVILVDQELLRSVTTGLIQIRARGEGFFNLVFKCRDDL